MGYVLPPLHPQAGYISLLLVVRAPIKQPLA